MGKGSPWDPDVKASDDFLDPLFLSYFGKLGLPNLMAKKNYHELADYVPDGEIDPEVGAKLEAIAQVAEDAAALRDIGMTRLMFNLLRPSLEQTFAAIDRFRENVMARLAS